MELKKSYLYKLKYIVTLGILVILLLAVTSCDVAKQDPNSCHISISIADSENAKSIHVSLGSVSIQSGLKYWVSFDPDETQADTAYSSLNGNTVSFEGTTFNATVSQGYWTINLYATETSKTSFNISDALYSGSASTFINLNTREIPISLYPVGKGSLTVRYDIKEVTSNGNTTPPTASLNITLKKLDGTVVTSATDSQLDKTDDHTYIMYSTKF